MARVRRRVDLSACVFLLPAAAVLFLFVVYPILWSFVASFFKIAEGKGDLLHLRPWSVPGAWAGLKMYRALFRDSVFWRSLWNTAVFAALFIPGTLVASMALALLVRRGLRGMGLFRAVFFLPHVVSIVAAGLVWKWMFDTRHGLVNALISLLGGEGPNWLGRPGLAMLVIALMCVWRWSGYFMLVFLAGLEAIPRELYDAAAVDGADSVAVFRAITLPLLRRPILFALIVLLIRAQNVFQEVYVMTDGGPANGTITVAYQIWRSGISGGDIGRGAAMSFLLFLAVLGVAVAQFALLGKDRTR